VWGTGRRAGEANVTEGLGVDPPTPASTRGGPWRSAYWCTSSWRANVKSRALYQRRKTHNSPDAESTLASSVTVKDADADVHQNNNTDYGYGDGYGYGYKAGESPRKQWSQYMPPQAATGLKALARPIVAISPAQTYEAMQIGAALRRLDERKHQETTAIAKKLIPKLNAVQRHWKRSRSSIYAGRSVATTRRLERLVPRRPKRSGRTVQL